MRPADVCTLVAERCLAPTAGGLVGIEVEWFPVAAGNPAERIPLDVLQEAMRGLGDLPGGAAITFEPGGQIELSSLPAAGAAAACAVLQNDLTVLRARLAERGISLLGVGLHPQGEPQRYLASARYATMELYFDRVEKARRRAGPCWGSPGRTMMSLTAAVQISVDLGPDPERSFRLASDLGPVLVAAFANSPFARGRPTGFRSTRFANWWHLDPARTHPIGRTGGAVAATARYALAAPVMGILVDGPGSDFLPMPTRPTFLQWIRDTGGRRPGLHDFAYHLTTLFPPVRPRGWLELRMIDALPGSMWEVPVALTAALFANPGGVDLQLDDAAGLWLEAARDGLAHPVLAETARRVFAEAAAILDASPADRALADTVRAYAERFVERGRCPADDALDAWHRQGLVLGAAEPVGA
jgi:glutamate--cysteine ligase